MECQIILPANIYLFKIKGVNEFKVNNEDTRSDVNDALDPDLYC